LTELKAGFVVGACLGTGIILARRPNKGWTGPCAIGLGGMSVGFQVGMQKTEHIIVLRDENVLKTFTSKGELKFGGDVSFAIGPLGRDANVSINVSNKGTAAMHSYSMSKGAYIGASLEGEVITIRNDCNEEYYGKKVTAEDILFGNVEPLQDNEYNLLCQSLSTYISSDTSKIENYSENVNITNKSDEVHSTDIRKDVYNKQDVYDDKDKQDVYNKQDVYDDKDKQDAYDKNKQNDVIGVDTNKQNKNMENM
jgi:lipid-binding SYLF domain-containing protein